MSKQDRGMAAAERIRAARGPIDRSPVRTRDKLEQRVTKILSGPLGALGEQLQSRGWLPPALGGFSSMPISRGAHVDRMREVLERDRALTEAQPAEAARPAAPPFEIAIVPIAERADEAARAWEVAAEDIVELDAETEAVFSDADLARPLVDAEAVHAAGNTAAAAARSVVDGELVTPTPQAPARAGEQAAAKSTRGRGANAATRSRTPPPPPPPPAPARAPRAKAACSEPIRTRTMAKLLLSQGHPDRALSIYDALIADGANDPDLLAEADALRNAQT